MRHASRFPVDRRIKLKGSNRRGKVLEVYTEPDKAKWDEASPKFVEVLMDDGELLIVNPRNLKTKGR